MGELLYTAVGSLTIEGQKYTGFDTYHATAARRHNKSEQASHTLLLSSTEHACTHFPGLRDIVLQAKASLPPFAPRPDGATLGGIKLLEMHVLEQSSLHAQFRGARLHMWLMWYTTHDTHTHTWHMHMHRSPGHRGGLARRSADQRDGVHRRG